MSCASYELLFETLTQSINVLCSLWTPSLRDSDPGYPVFIQVNVFVFRAGHVVSYFNVLCFLWTPSLRDSDPGYPVFIQVNDFLFRAGLLASSFNVLCFLWTPSLEDSDPGYPVFIQTDERYSLSNGTCRKSTVKVISYLKRNLFVKSGHILFVVTVKTPHIRTTSFKNLCPKEQHFHPFYKNLATLAFK